MNSQANDHPDAFFHSNGQLLDWHTGAALPEGWTGLALRRGAYFYVGRDGDETSYTALFAKTVAGARQEIEERGIAQPFMAARHIAVGDRRYALVSELPDSGIKYSAGGIWEGDFPRDGTRLLTMTEAQAMLARHSHAAIFDVPRCKMANRAYNEGYRCVLAANERSTPSTRQAARDAGMRAAAEAGFTEHEVFPHRAIGASDATPNGLSVLGAA